jgi:hypothetical protein
MFTEIANATIKNLTVAGAIDGAAADTAAVAVKASGTLVFENIVSNVAITNAANVGAILSIIDSATSVTVTGCINNGAITGTKYAAGIAAKINCGDAAGTNSSKVAVTNCANYGDITGGSYTAGIAAAIQNTLNCVVTKCVNYGFIKGGHDSGGIIGHTTQAPMTLSFCENFGTVDTTGSKQYAGGIVGYAWGTKQTQFSAETFDYTNIVEYNVNHANVTGDTRTGGIVGSFGASDSRGIWLCQYNVNLGNVTSNGAGGKLSGDCAGGIVGYAYGSGKVACAYIMNNLTLGNVESKGAQGVASYILGYISSNGLTKITGNTASGTVTAANGNAFAFGWNNNEAYIFLDCSGNTIPADCTLFHTRELGLNDKVYEVSAFDMAKLVSGEYVYNFNQAAGKDVLYMTVNGTDFAPTLIADEEKAVVKNADGTYGNPVKAPETTEPAPETTEPPVSGETGDSFVVFAAIAAISVLGVAVVAKRREN